MQPRANLVIQTAFLGDLILSVPTLLRIKKKFPADKLVVVCRAGVGEFLLNDGIADVVIEVKKSDADSYEKALNLLRQFSIRNLYCLHRSARSALFSAKVTAEYKIGFSSFLGFWVFDENIHHLSENHEVLRQMKILETTDDEVSDHLNAGSYAYLNYSDTEGRFPSIPIFFKFAAAEKKADVDRHVAIFPGSVWPTKKWTIRGYLELCRMLSSEGIKISLMGGAAELDICKEIADEIPAAQILAGKLTIAQSMRYLQNCDLVVCNDSASTHMAAYSGVPVVAVFGPTTSAMGFRPWIDNSYVVEDKTMNCRPCGRHGHKECPLKHHACMQSIEAQTVYLKIRQILSGPTAS